MIVLIHVIFALSSIGYTTYLFFRPSRVGMKAGYSLVAATLASGTYLVVSLHAQLLSSCITGLAYLSVVSLGLALAHHRLATQSTEQ